jgi:succinate dehydrogenase / fumarate reductase membrane anchor subunit
MSLRTPLGRALGLGAAKEGAGHWWAQRVSSIALALLSLWLVGALVALGDYGHASVIGFIGRPLNAVLLALLVGTAVYHSQLGVQVVVEDYVTNHATKIVSMLLLNFLHVVLAALGIFAILRIAFGAAA